jgi:hypothetical protein
LSLLARNAQVKGIFPIRILSESHQHPPRVISNNLLEVQELSVVAITKAHLEITHPDSLPSGIKYTVQSQPAHGRLHLDGHREHFISNVCNPFVTSKEKKSLSGPASV